MKYLLILLISAAIFLSCQKKIVSEDIFWEFTISKDNLPADGSSTLDITVRLADHVSEDRRNLVFEVDNGTLGEKTVKAKFDSGRMVAKTTLKAPFVPGKITLKVRTEFDSPIAEYELTKEITVTPSEAAQITVEPSFLGIPGNFLWPIDVVGRMRNSDKKNVQRGISVRFQDFLSPTQSAGGAFSKEIVASGDSSLVRTQYYAPGLPIGTRITIRATVLDAQLSPTGITGTSIITINQ